MHIKISIVIRIKMMPCDIAIRKIGHDDIFAAILNKLGLARIHLGEMIHTGKCIRRFAGIYAYCRYFIDRKW